MSGVFLGWRVRLLLGSLLSPQCTTQPRGNEIPVCRLKKDREAFSPQNMLELQGLSCSPRFLLRFRGDEGGRWGRRTADGRNRATNALVGRVGGRYWRVLCGTWLR